MRRIASLFLSFVHSLIRFLHFFSLYVWMCVYAYAYHFFIFFVLHPTTKSILEYFFFLKLLQMGNCLTDDDKQKICNRTLHAHQQRYREKSHHLAQTKQNTMKSSASSPHSRLHFQNIRFVSFDVVSMLKFLIILLSRRTLVIKIVIIKSSKCFADSFFFLFG